MSAEPLLNKTEDDATSANPGSQQYHSINGEHGQDAETYTPTSAGRNAERAEEYRVYGRRWYILILFSLMAGTQGGVWNTFGPISTTVEDAFGWNNGDIGLLNNWGPISFIVSTVPLIWALERKGLRVACLWAAFFIASGTLVRIFTVVPPAVTILMNVGQALNGLAGPIAMAGPPAVSAVWFPPHQRTTATSIGTFFGMLGTASGFLIGPMLVPDVPTNSTGFGLRDLSVNFFLNNRSEEGRISTEREAIHRLMYIECGWACAIFLAMFIYFPKKPPLPPSTSAAIQREDFYVGIKNIFKLPQFWIIGLTYALPQGVLNCWSSVINIILKPHGIGETEAGWVAFSATCGGCVMSILFAILADYLKRVMKWFVLLFYTMGAASFLTFALAAQGIIPPSTALFFTTIIMGTSVIFAATPLIFELACEISYPTGEGTANGVLTLLNNLFGGIFLLIMLDPSIGTVWMNWTLFGASVVCVPLLFFMKEHYNRLDLDEHNPSLTAEYIVEPSIEQC